MYDISQLNDMLVPELKDIADQLSIPHAQKVDKQDLIYKILDRQTVAESTDKNPTPERGKRKRIAKTTNAPVAEVAEVMTAPEPPPPPPPASENHQKKDGYKNAGPK